MPKKYDAHDKYTELVYAADGDVIALAVLEEHKPQNEWSKAPYCSSDCADWDYHEPIPQEFPCSTVEVIANILKVEI